MIDINLNKLNKKGVTITSLTIYVIVMTIIIGVLLFLNVQFFSNISELTKEANIDSNRTNFKAAFLSDLKGSANVSEYSNNRLKLSNNVVWEIRELSDAKTDKKAYAIFRNDVKIADYIIKNPLLKEEDYRFFDYDSLGNYVKTDWVYSDGNKFDYEYSSYLVGSSTKFVFIPDNVDVSVLPTTIPLTTPVPTVTVVTPSPTPIPSITPKPTRPPHVLNSSITIDSVYSNRKVQPGEDIEFNIMFAESGDGEIVYPYDVSYEMKVIGPGGVTITSGDPLSIPGVTMNDEGVYTLTWTINNARELNDRDLNPKKFTVRISRTLPAGSVVLTNVTGENNTFNIPIEQNVKIQQPTRKNIILLLDCSGSMVFCMKEGHGKDSDSDEVRKHYLFPTKYVQWVTGKALAFDSYRDMVCLRCCSNYNNSGSEERLDRISPKCKLHPEGTITFDNTNNLHYCSLCLGNIKQSGTNYKCSVHTSSSNVILKCLNSDNQSVSYCKACSLENILTYKCKTHGTTYMEYFDDKPTHPQVVPYCKKCGVEYPSRLKALQEAAKSFSKSILENTSTTGTKVTFTIIQFNDFVTLGETLSNPQYQDVEKQIDELRAVAGTFVDSGLSAVNDLLDSEKILQNATNFVVFLSDGIPTSGKQIKAKTLEKYRSHETESYAVGLGKTFAREEMKKIVDNDETRIFSAENESDLISRFNDIAVHINSIQTSEGFLDTIYYDDDMWPVILSGSTWDDLDYVVELGKAEDEAELENMNITIGEDNRLIIDFSKYSNYTNFVITLGQN